MAERKYDSIPHEYLEEVVIPQTNEDAVITEINPPKPIFSIEEGFILANQASLGSVKQRIGERGGPLIDRNLVMEFSDKLDALRAGGYELEVVVPMSDSKSNKNLENRLTTWSTLERTLELKDYQQVKESQPELIQRLLEYYQTLRERDVSLFQLVKPK